MVPSALRSLSVVMLLGAVSGTVIATTPQSDSSAGTPASSVRAAEQDLSGRISLTGASTTLSSPLSSTQAGSGITLTGVALTGTTLAASPLAGLHTTAQRQAASRTALAAAKAESLKQAAAKKAAAQKKKAAERKAAAERKEKARKRASRNSPRNSQAIARELVAKRGWKSGQYTCLQKLWTKESGWRHTADNPSSSAYGIPQALPGSKMKSAGKDWKTNPATQIKWGLGYIKDRYGSPCGAWAHSRAHNWY